MKLREAAAKVLDQIPLLTVGKYLVGAGVASFLGWVAAAASSNHDIFEYPFWVCIGVSLAGVVIFVIGALAVPSKRGLTDSKLEPSHHWTPQGRSELPDDLQLRSYELKGGSTARQWGRLRRPAPSWIGFALSILAFLGSFLVFFLVFFLSLR